MRVNGRFFACLYMFVYILCVYYVENCHAIFPPQTATTKYKIYNKFFILEFVRLIFVLVSVISYLMLLAKMLNATEWNFFFFGTISSA